MPIGVLSSYYYNYCCEIFKTTKEKNEEDNHLH